MTTTIDWKKTTAFEGPEESPGFLLWQVSTRWRRQIETSLATLGLTHPQFVLLACLGWLMREGKDVTQVELSRQAGTDIAMTSQVLRTLERKGYIQRKRNGDDERVKLPTLTKSGTALVERAIPLVEAADQKFFEKLGEDTKAFVRIFQRLI
jgi:DNA-binding MarR family transcriptional regulator